MPFSKMFLIAVLASLLLACANKPDNPENLRQKLTLRIEEDGSKRFALIVWRYNQYSKPQSASSSTKERKQMNKTGRTKSSLKAQDALSDYLDEQLEVAIKTNHYCRQGYFIIERYLGEKSYIKGECNESATAKDRQIFG
jgi:hypothetical protein